MEEKKLSASDNHADSQINMKYVWMISMIAALGGLLFGYDFVVIGGAKPFYERYFHLISSAQIGWAMSSALVGCLAGALLSGGLSDKFGRKKLLLLSAIIFTVSSIGTGLSHVFAMFITWRLTGGIAIGLASNLSPMYIAEVSPAKIRGKLVSINQLTIVIGILAAQLINYLIAKPVPPNATSLYILNSWNGQMGWRWMFGVTAIPSLFFFIGMFIVPESPRWLAKNGKPKKCREILTLIGGDKYAANELFEINQSLINETEKVDFRELLEPRMMRILLIGVTLAIFQQWCGINVIFNYAEEIFSAAGYKVSDILFNIVVTGVVNLLFTFAAIYTVDKLGRKLLMLSGAAGLSVIYLLLGLSYHLQLHGLHVLLLVVAAIGCYSFSLAPVTWVILSEIYPNRIRGAAMSVSTFALWLGCFTLTYTFPLMNSSLGPAGTFWTYAVICCAGFVYIRLRLPETKGKSLEEIERDLVGITPHTQARDPLL
jgi:SP family sugar porter-like MFS transporter